MKSDIMPPKLRLKLANECKDLVAKTKLAPVMKKFQFYLLHSDQINEDTREKMLTLFESLMKEMYEKSSWGWNRQKKVAEFKSSRTRAILVTKSDTHNLPTSQIGNAHTPVDENLLVGFICFRFETGIDKNEAVLYVYELHICEAYQRQGLGEELMRMAKEMAIGLKMDKVMLTVFRHNEPALKFYQKLGYKHDESCPSKSEADYLILSSKIKS